MKILAYWFTVTASLRAIATCLCTDYRTWLTKATTYSLSHANLTVSEDGESRLSARYFGEVAQVSAGHQTEARANARTREVAGTTLGVSFLAFPVTE